MKVFDKELNRIVERINFDLLITYVDTGEDARVDFLKCFNDSELNRLLETNIETENFEACVLIREEMNHRKIR